ncbi:hypothetical protein BT69DRAFT_1339185 [Atractiella rhizophila]|nr:hypothetical protein BT69DRAFT_1339185 [Atractiella rhizophila]
MDNVFRPIFRQKEEADKLKKEKEKLAGQLSALRDRFKPFDVQCAQLQEGVRRKKASVVKANDNVTKLVASYSRTKDALSKVDDDLGKVRSDLETVKKNEEEAQNQIRKLQKEIRALEKVVEKVPDRPDTTTFKSRVDPLERQLNALRQEVKQLDEEKAQWSDSREKARRDISHAENQLARLQDARQQRDHQCQLADQTLWKAVCWIRENKDRFKGALPQPLRLAVSIKDRYKNNSRIVTLAESVFSHANLRTFVCTERDDYILLTEELNKKQRLRVNLAELPQTRGELSSRVPTEQLSQYGLDAYVSDLLDAPEEVMVYLKLTQNLHNLPVAFKPSQEVNGDLVNPRIFRSYLTYDSAFSFSKSKYGAGNMTTTAKTIQSSRDSWMRTTDNEDLRREWEQTRAHHVNLKDEATKKLEAATAQKDELNSQIGPLKEEINEINEEKKRVTQAWNDWNKANNELAGKNKHLVKVTDRPKEEDEQKRHTKKLLSICENRRKMALEAKRVLFSIVDATAEAQILSLELLQAEANAAHLQGQIDEKREILLMKEQEYEHSRTAHKSLTTECKMLFATAQQAMDGVEEELKTKFRQAHMEEDRQPVPKVDEIEELIQAQRTQLDMTEEVSQDIRDQYNTRKAKIIHLRRQVEASSARLHNISRAVQEIRDQWYPALQSLIKGISKKFDQAFARMGCQGEVQIAEESDYAKWGIRIMVSFRDGDEMQPLTGQRQSGGERSLSTILYLMSLTELSKSPFSLVDEINQGMDQRAERAVHNQLVEVTCKDEAGQYFLITPKLLPNLRYHRLMKILCINNGEWLPEKVSLKQIVSSRRVKAA